MISVELNLIIVFSFTLYKISITYRFDTGGTRFANATQAQSVCSRVLLNNFRRHTNSQKDTTQTISVSDYHYERMKYWQHHKLLLHVRLLSTVRTLFRPTYRYNTVQYIDFLLLVHLCHEYQIVIIVLITNIKNTFDHNNKTTRP